LDSEETAMPLNRIITFAIAALLTAVSVAGAAAEDQGQKDDGQEQVYAIQNRIFDKRHELAFACGYIPDMDFYDSFPVSLAYSYHYDETWEWEVLRGQWVLGREKDLKSDLENEFGATPEDFDRIDYAFHSSLVMKPTYGKDALGRQKILNHETFVSAGIGMISYERKHSFGPDSYERALSLAFGMGRKYFLNEHLCLDLELRDLINFKDEGVENNIYVGFGFGFRFNLEPRKSEDEGELKVFKSRIRGRDSDGQ